ncbi:MAG: ATP-binding protein [bacterium]
MNKNNPAKIYIKRDLEIKILPFLARKEAISIVGPRQAGKTTFISWLSEKLKVSGKKVKLITFEKIADLELFQNNVEDFKSLISQYDCVIIDEFQYAKEGGQKLKYLYDTTDIKFIITGSSSLDLTFQTGKYMVGRLFDFYLMPFSFREFLSYKDPELCNLLKQKITASIFDFDIRNGFGLEINKRLCSILEKYAVFGGYPAVALSENDAEKIKILESIVEKYLLRDIKTLLNLATDDELIKLGKFLASQIGNLINYSELSNISGLSYSRLKKHIFILEKTYIINLIKPFFTNKRQELAKNPKAYFIDFGLRNYLINDFRAVELRNDKGAIMENCARIMLSNLEISREIKFWRTKSKAEVDFILEYKQNICPVEIKYSSKRIIGKSFYSFIDKFKPEIGIILTKNYISEEKIRNTKVKFIPLSYF